MNEEHYEHLAQMKALEGQSSQNELAQVQQQYYREKEEKGLASEQLDVEEIILNIHNLILGKEYVVDNSNVGTWKRPEGMKRTLSDWGVHRIMQTVRFHINKNNLLSNYNEDQIKRLMLRFTNEMNNLLLLKYEVLFEQPTFEDCKKILEAEIHDKRKRRMFVIELLGQEPDEKKITKEIIQEMEHRIDYEMEKIKKRELKERIKEYGLILEELEAAVYATYNRAWKGEERGSLRRHSSFSEIFSPNPPSQNKRGGIFNWRRN